MISVSDAFLATMAERGDFRCRATVTLADGTALELGADDFSVTGNRLSDGAGADGLPLGVAVCRTIAIEIENMDERFSSYSFVGATISLHLVFTLGDLSEEEIEMGTFTVLEPETPGTFVQITASDDMHRADISYDTVITYPATLGDIFIDACDRCGIAYENATFRNSDFEVMAKPDGYTYRQIFGMIAMIAGGNARVNRFGMMEILSYNFFREADHTLDGFFDLTVSTNDITITGISAKASAYVDGKVVTTEILDGEAGYVITLDNNPMIEGKESEVIDSLRDLFVGATFRRFGGEHTAYPLAEFMDAVTVIDRKGNSHFSILTDIDFTFLGSSEFSNSAASEQRVNSEYSVIRDPNKTIDEVRAELMAQISRTEAGLSLSVAELQKKVDLSVSAEDVKITVQKAVDEINSITTETGYTFNADGMRIAKEGDEIENLLDNTGMYVNRDNENILTANNTGVSAINVTVRKYLVIGKNSRLEDYGSDRTACFWIGD